MPCDGQVSCLECLGGKRGEPELILQTKDLGNAGKCINELLTEILLLAAEELCGDRLLHFLLVSLLFFSVICLGFFWQDSFLKQGTGPHTAFLGKKNYHWLFFYMHSSYPLCFNQTTLQVLL